MATLPVFPHATELVWRPLAPRDVATVAALEAQIHAAPWTLGNFNDALAAGYSTRVAERDGRIVAYGVLMLAPGEAQLLNVSVVHDARRQGLGRALVDDAMAWCAEKGVDEVCLGVAPRSMRSRRFYERYGFEEVSVLMVKTVTASA